MIEGDNTPNWLRPKELEAVYAISRTVILSEDVESALNKIVRLVRTVLIFDNMVLYTCSKDGLLEPTYAKAIGRGRNREADLSWGDVIAQNTFQKRETITHVEKLDGVQHDRTDVRLSLGVPVMHGDESMGALVFIRFGGPIFLPDHIQLAEFIAVHVAQLLDHHQLVERIASLEARRRLDSLQEDFVATISHELLTPLGFIKGYATTLLREDITWDEQSKREFLTIIDDESDRLRELIDNLMDSSRLQSGTLNMTFQPIRLDTMLKDIVLRAMSRNENMKIELDIKNPGLKIMADPTRLAQVFDNILGNANKYASGSPITIAVAQQKKRVRIAIKDKGPGIPAEHLDKVFLRFYRIPNQSTSVRGTGLGLYICRKIIQGHNGEIEAESAEGKGTTFNIYLPLPST
jgi:signal transduction histidine kinase